MSFAEEDNSKGFLSNCFFFFAKLLSNCWDLEKWYNVAAPAFFTKVSLVSNLKIKKINKICTLQLWRSWYIAPWSIVLEVKKFPQKFLKEDAICLKLVGEWKLQSNKNNKLSVKCQNLYSYLFSRTADKIWPFLFCN